MCEYTYIMSNMFIMFTEQRVDTVPTYVWPNTIIARTYICGLE